MKTKEMVMTAVCTGLLAVCSWISIPTAVPFTLQTFGVFLVLLLLGGKLGTLSVAVYILLGAVGLPVFSGGTGGLGILFGKTGGYILGFLTTGFLYWGAERIFGTGKRIQAMGLIAGLAVCYLFGTLWFMAVYALGSGAIGFVSVLGICVVPFLVPDGIKLALALVLGRRLRRFMNL